MSHTGHVPTPSDVSTQLEDTPDKSAPDAETIDSSMLNESDSLKGNLVTKAYLSFSCTLEPRFSELLQHLQESHVFK